MKTENNSAQVSITRFHDLGNLCILLFILKMFFSFQFIISLNTDLPLFTEDLCYFRKNPGMLYMRLVHRRCVMFNFLDPSYSTFWNTSKKRWSFPPNMNHLFGLACTRQPLVPQVFFIMGNGGISNHAICTTPTPRFQLSRLFFLIRRWKHLSSLWMTTILTNTRKMEALSRRHG